VFDNGRELSPAELTKLFKAARLGFGRLRNDHLVPVDSHAMLRRMLANLIGIFQAAEDRASLTWVLRLRTCIPGAPVSEFGHLAKVLAATGRFADAAAVEAQLGACITLDDQQRAAHVQRAAALRARLN
jgi:hypothetical protein